MFQMEADKVGKISFVIDGINNYESLMFEIKQIFLDLMFLLF